MGKWKNDLYRVIVIKLINSHKYNKILIIHLCASSENAGVKVYLALWAFSDGGFSREDKRGNIVHSLSVGAFIYSVIPRVHILNTAVYRVQPLASFESRMYTWDLWGHLQGYPYDTTDV